MNRQKRPRKPATSGYYAPAALAERFRALLRRDAAGDSQGLKLAQQIARRYGLRVIRPEGTRHRPWTAADVLTLRAMYPDSPMRDLRRALDRSTSQIYAKATSIGVRRSPAYLAAHGGRILPGQNLSPGTQFKAGEPSIVTGMRFPGRISATTFAAGKQPHNYYPPGTERIDHAGYRQIKVRDDGPPKHRWLFVHRLLWEQHHGPLPPRRIVYFRDGNAQNITIENLATCSQAEWMHRHSLHRLPPELLEVTRLRGRITRAIRTRTEQQTIAHQDQPHGHD